MTDDERTQAEKLAEEAFPEGEYTSLPVQLAFRCAFVLGYQAAKDGK